jgi:hypothetical protein
MQSKVKKFHGRPFQLSLKFVGKAIDYPIIRHYTEKTLLDKHSSLFAWSVSDKEKCFITTTTGNSIIKLFFFVTYKEPNKLKCFVPGKTLQLNELFCKLQLSGAPQG